MMTRLLFDADPAGNASGGGVDPPAPVEKPASPGMVTLTAEEYSRFFKVQAEQAAKLSAFEAEKQAALDAAEQKRLKDLGEKEGIEAVLKEANKAAERKAAEAEAKAVERLNRLINKERDVATAKAFAGVEFVSDEAKADAIQKLNGLVKSELAEDGVTVVFKSGGKIVTEAEIASLAKGSGFQHYVKNKSAGGSGSKGGDLSSEEATDPVSIAIRDYQKVMSRQTNEFGLRSFE